LTNTNNPKVEERMATVLDELRNLKTQAKNRRDLRRYNSAARLLERAIALATTNLAIGELRGQMAEELADCNGLLGGVQRRWALESDGEERSLHLVESIRAYDAAWEFESGDYGVVNSYGMVNRLVSRLLLTPDSLFAEGLTDFGKNVQPLAMRAQFQEAGQRIEAQLARPRRDDYWAVADLALVNVLLEKQEAVSAYSGFLEKSPPDYAFKSVLDVLRPLAGLKWKLADELMKAVVYLEQRAPSLRPG
jgi:tetratricopeptide (TPR) repeat protein